MKSFHPFSRKPVASPERVVTDYALEDIAEFREQFRPVVDRYRRRWRVAGFGLAAFFLCIISAQALPNHLFLYFWAAGICLWFFVVFAVPRTPDCPACHTRLGADFGAFCPECGSRSLQAGSWFRSPQCSSCGKSMRRRKGRNYKIRACTHCGVMLDERGL